MRPLVIFIVGPTASGKSTLAIEVAKRLNGEVVSADSMLIYQGMDIGTAKLSIKERRGIPHHLVDIIAPSKNFSVFDYRKRALKAIADITKRGKIPIVAGGTGFYVRALLEGLQQQPGADPRLRKALEAEAAEKGLPALYKRLLKLDPKRGRAIDPNNKRRIIRALEILQVSHRKVDAGRREPSLKQLGYRPVVIGLHRDRTRLYESINRRVDLMFRRGLVNEVKRLAKKKISKTALQGVGYKEILNALNIGKLTNTHEVKEAIKKATRHFAKRQWTWFKREKGIRWIWWPEQASVSDVCDFLFKDLIHGG